MAYNLANLQILLVEDNVHMRALTRAMLIALGVQGLRDAYSGEHAMQQLASFKPDIVITDWVMEPVDGIELTKFIRNSEHSPDVFLPVIMMTGHTEKWRVLQARDAGVTEFLAKPISAQTLYQRLLAVIEKPRPFVRTKEFFGPCRRRQNWVDYLGVDRRSQRDDAVPASVGDMELDQLLQSL